MLSRRPNIKFHHDWKEWNDPHLRRFTQIGFQKYLEIEFQHLVAISHLRRDQAARFIGALGIPVLYFQQGGPTYIANNSLEALNSVKIAIRLCQKILKNK